MGPVKCSYFGCNNTSANQSLFRFPTANSKRLEVWLINCGNMTITHLPHQALHNRFLCMVHFDKKFIKNDSGRRRRLVRWAVPDDYKKVSQSAELSPQSLIPSTSQAQEKSTYIVLPPVRKYGRRNVYDKKEEIKTNRLLNTETSIKKTQQMENDTLQCEKLKLMSKNSVNLLKKEKHKCSYQNKKVSQSAELSPQSLIPSTSQAQEKSTYTVLPPVRKYGRRNVYDKKEEIKTNRLLNTETSIKKTQQMENDTLKCKKLKLMLKNSVNLLKKEKQFESCSPETEDPSHKVAEVTTTDLEPCTELESVSDDVLLNEEDMQIKSEPSDPETEETDVHEGIVCNVCEKQIVGFRYVCVQCADWDHCAACEAGGAHALHAVLRAPGTRAEVQRVIDAVREAVRCAEPETVTLHMDVTHEDGFAEAMDEDNKDDIRLSELHSPVAGVTERNPLDLEVPFYAEHFIKSECETFTRDCHNLVTDNIHEENIQTFECPTADDPHNVIHRPETYPVRVFSKPNNSELIRVTQDMQHSRTDPIQRGGDVIEDDFIKDDLSSIQPFESRHRDTEELMKQISSKYVENKTPIPPEELYKSIGWRNRPHIFK